jgi:hypothetical protein
MPKKGGDGAWQRTDSWNRVNNGNWVHEPGKWEQASSRALSAQRKKYQNYFNQNFNPSTFQFPIFKKKRGFLSTVKHRVRKAVGLSASSRKFQTIL